VGYADGLVDRYVSASGGFVRRLRDVRSDQWDGPTPCTEWTVRQLVNHMTQANLSYVRLLDGGTSAEFIRSRDVDVLGGDPAEAYARSVRDCADAFAGDGALRRMLDHPLGRMTAQQGLAMRTTDSVIHTWDLARAVGADERLDDDLVSWIAGHLDEIYAGLPETPVSAGSTHRFFAAPEGVLPPDASPQDRLLHTMGRQPRQ
jgi:uncharacterized protein (TIGR03086 family)